MVVCVFLQQRQRLRSGSRSTSSPRYWQCGPTWVGRYLMQSRLQLAVVLRRPSRCLTGSLQGTCDPSCLRTSLLVLRSGGSATQPCSTRVLLLPLHRQPAWQIVGVQVFLRSTRTGTSNRLTTAIGTPYSASSPPKSGTSVRTPSQSKGWLRHCGGIVSGVLASCVASQLKVE